MKEALVFLSIEQGHAEHAGIAQQQWPEAFERQCRKQPRQQLQQWADQQHAQWQKHKQTQRRQLQRHQQPLIERVAEHAHDQHQTCRRNAQGMDLTALTGQQRIDGQRPVQHEVVDQGGADKRKQDFGHDRPYPMLDNSYEMKPDLRDSMGQT
ncbi:hypothetical protein D3C87_1313960 [compost metagenome]